MKNIKNIIKIIKINLQHPRNHKMFKDLLIGELFIEDGSVDDTVYMKSRISTTDYDVDFAINLKTGTPVFFDKDSNTIRVSIVDITRNGR